jgi:glutamate 5-kinase
MARYVVKLGSSIVAEDSGALRPDVLARVCDRVAARHATGDDVVVVTSGAIARGIQLMGLSPRPTAIEDLQAASAVGQGKLYRVYDELLRERGVTSAQVLLTFFDMSARTHYLNARQTLRRLLDWSVVPVINENDTTTTDEISFGDNDFLAAQVAILIGADLLVLLTDIDGLFTADPRTDPAAALVDEVDRLRALDAIDIGHGTSPLGSGGMRSKVVAAEMATAAGSRPSSAAAWTRPRWAPSSTGEPRARASRPSRRATPRSSSGCATPSPRTARWSSTPAPPGPCARVAPRCCRSGSSRSAAASTPVTPCTWPRARRSSARASPTTRPPSCARSRE